MRMAPMIMSHISAFGLLLVACKNAAMTSAIMPRMAPIGLDRRELVHQRKCLDLIGQDNTCEEDSDINDVLFVHGIILG
jgi:hypothetical protein